MAGSFNLNLMSRVLILTVILNLYYLLVQVAFKIALSC